MSIFLLNSYVYEVADTPVERIANAQAMSFNGTDQYVSAGNITSLNNLSAFSTSSWINYSGTPSGTSHIFLSGGSGASNRFYIELVGSTTIRYGSGSGYVDVAVSSVSSGSWHHIVTVHDGTSLDVYLDGVKQNPSSVLTTSPNTSIGQSFKIGSYFSPVGFLWSGKLDEVALFNTELSSEKITQIYDATAVVGGVPQTANLFTGGLDSSLVYWNRMGDS